MELSPLLSVSTAAVPLRPRCVDRFHIEGIYTQNRYIVRVVCRSVGRSYAKEAGCIIFREHDEQAAQVCFHRQGPVHNQKDTTNDDLFASLKSETAILPSPLSSKILRGEGLHFVFLFDQLRNNRLLAVGLVCFLLRSDTSFANVHTSIPRNEIEKLSMSSTNHKLQELQPTPRDENCRPGTINDLATQTLQIPQFPIIDDIEVPHYVLIFIKTTQVQ